MLGSQPFPCPFDQLQLDIPPKLILTGIWILPRRRRIYWGDEPLTVYVPFSDVGSTLHDPIELTFVPEIREFLRVAYYEDDMLAYP